jgi:hypothetical protein
VPLLNAPGNPWNFDLASTRRDVDEEEFALAIGGLGVGSGVHGTEREEHESEGI